MSSILKVDTLQDVNGNAIISSDGSGNISIPNLTTTGDINFGDNDKAVFGAGSDLQIFHDGGNSIISEAGSGNLILQTNGNEIYLAGQSGNEYMLRAVNNGATELYYDNSKKLETTSSGIDVTGTITFDGGTTSADLNFGDNDKAVFGAGSDLEIYHDGTDSLLVDNGTGKIQVRSNGDNIEIASSKTTLEKMANFVCDGASELYYDGTKKFETTSGGVTVTGTVTATAFSGTINTPIAMADCFLLGSDIVGGGSFDITSGFARRTGDGFNQIGTGLTESSGEFSFPQTGYYLINFFSLITNGGNDTTCSLSMKYTDNNFSTESPLIQHNAGHSATGNSISCHSASSAIIDVTDITNQKFKFSVFSLNSTVEGDTGNNLTGFTIIRLGDT